MRFRNLTPHPVTVKTQFGLVEFQPEPISARRAVMREEIQKLMDIPMFSTQLGEVENLPDETIGVMLIVSAIVRTAFPDRHDLVSPSGLVRDAAGRVIACEGFDVNY